MLEARSATSEAGHKWWQRGGRACPHRERGPLKDLIILEVQGEAQQGLGKWVLMG